VPVEVVGRHQLLEGEVAEGSEGPLFSAQHDGASRVVATARTMLAGDQLQEVT
jgi:hypothetical protein